ncbi:HK97 gp10 family phage protein [Halocalculus aciditolerans]|uniref:HK97 gp10 family phage protein n=1 Tax=Halocalculus aciditolerans TaxID=1383812 RepID=A0A830FH13_9EURY|nr:HK97 gp10 family phage protein [Halocalculus aciditolerans]GGL55137.1 hypothetical protein GCM10009039_11570 [Halocalculus aciditolerans]
MANGPIKIEWENGHAPKDVKQRLRRLVEELRSELKGAMEWAVDKIEATAKKLAPVDTGRLRSDINNAVNRIARDAVRGRVGNSVEYAPVQEYVYNPYLGPALEAHVVEIRDHFERVVSEVCGEVSRS